VRSPYIRTKNDFLTCESQRKVMGFIPKGRKGDTGSTGSQGIQGVKGDTATQEIGRVELTTEASTITVTLSENKKNLLVEFLLIPTGTMLAQMIFNGNVTNTKAERVHDNHDSILEVVNDNEIQISDADGEDSLMKGTIEITNIQNQIKLGVLQKIGVNGTTAMTVPTFKNSAFKWINTTDYIIHVNPFYTFPTFLNCRVWLSLENNSNQKMRTCIHTRLDPQCYLHPLVRINRS